MKKKIQKKSVTIVYLVLILAALVPVLFTVYHANKKEVYIQTGSGPDPLRQLAITTQEVRSTSAIELALNGVQMQNFIEMYCYEPLEVVGQKFLIADITITNKQANLYNVSLARFYVLDMRNKKHPAHTDSRVYDGSMLRPFGMVDDSGNGFLWANSSSEGNLIFQLPEEIIPVKLGYEDVSGTMLLKINSSALQR